MKRRQLPLRIVLRAFAACLLLALVAALLVWIFRTSIVDHFAKQTLADNGFDQAELYTHEVSFHGIQVEDVKLKTGYGDFAANSIEASYTLEELLGETRIQNIRIDDASAALDVPLLAKKLSSPETEETEKNQLPEINLSWIEQLPFHGAQLRNLTIDLAGLPQSVRLEADATASHEDKRLRLEASVSQGSNSLSVTSDLSQDSTSTFKAQLSLPDPKTTIGSLYPGWIESAQIPEALSIEVGKTRADVSGTLPANEPPSLQFTSEIDFLSFTYDDLHAALASVSATSQFDFEKPLSASISFLIEDAYKDDFRITQGDLISLSLSQTNASTWQVSAAEPIRWNYSDSFVTGSSRFELNYDSAETASPLSGRAETHSLVVSDLHLQPVSLSFSGTTNKLHIESSPIKLDTYEQAITSNSKGTLLIPDDDASIEFSFVSELLGTAFSSFLPGLTSDNLGFEVLTKVDDFTTQVELKLNSAEGFHIALPAKKANAAFGLSLSVAATELAENETWTGEARSTVSNLSGQFDTITAEGAAVETTLSFADISESIFPDEASISLEALLRRLGLQADFQANRIASDIVEANWVGGSFSFSPSQDSLDSSFELGAGIVRASALSLEQFGLKAKARGDLSQWVVESESTAMLEGVPLKLNSTQTFLNPFTDLSLSGEYKLQQMQFLHSDLMGRFSSELNGITFSALIDADGSFHFADELFDADISARITDASLSNPASKVSASGISANFFLDSLSNLTSGDKSSVVSIKSIQAGDLMVSDIKAAFRFSDQNALIIEEASASLLGGTARVEPIAIPLDGSDFEGTISFERLSLEQLTGQIDSFRGVMRGVISGYLPFAFKNGNFALRRGVLDLPQGEHAIFRYDATGLLSGDSDGESSEKKELADRILETLDFQPEVIVEQALGDVTIEEFTAELFPPDAPETPVRIRFSGIAHTEKADIPLVITTNIHGSLSEFYNFLIRLNSL